MGMNPECNHHTLSRDFAMPAEPHCFVAEPASMAAAVAAVERAVHIAAKGGIAVGGEHAVAAVAEEHIVVAGERSSLAASVAGAHTALEMLVVGRSSGIVAVIVQGGTEAESALVLLKLGELVLDWRNNMICSDPQMV